MFLTGIERVLKRAGVKYTIVSGAMERTAHRGGLREVRAQMFHTTETKDAIFARGKDAPTLGYVRSGLGYPLYNLLYGRSGHVYVIACGTAAHAGTGSGFGMPKDEANFYSIGHSADANSSRYPITAAQLDSMAKVAKSFNDDWDTPRTTVMHGEWAPGRRSDPTKVPGGWAALKRAVARGSWDGSAPSGGVTSTTKPAAKPAAKPVTVKTGEWPANPLAVDGKFWLVTKRAYQRLLAPKNVGDYRGTIDGEIGPRTVRSEQRWLASLGRYKGPIDGDRGPRTIRALQRFLAAKGLYKRNVDGSHGAYTTRALQQYLNSQRKHYR